MYKNNNTSHISCPDAISYRDFKDLINIVSSVNEEIVTLSHGKMAGTEYTIQQCFANIDNCVSKRNNNIHYGGLDPRIMKACIRWSIVLSIAVAIYGAIKFTELDQINCYSWYSPFAQFVRTPIQNTYCNALRHAHKEIDSIIVKGIRVDDMNQVYRLGALFTTGTVTLKMICKQIQRFNTQLDVIVDYAYNISDRNLKQDAIVAVEDMIDNLQKPKNNNKVNNNKVNNNLNSSQYGGRRRRTTSKSYSQATD